MGIPIEEVIPTVSKEFIQVENTFLTEFLKPYREKYPEFKIELQLVVDLNSFTPIGTLWVNNKYRMPDFCYNLELQQDLSNMGKKEDADKIVEFIRKELDTKLPVFIEALKAGSVKEDVIISSKRID